MKQVSYFYFSCLGYSRKLSRPLQAGRVSYNCCWYSLGFLFSYLDLKDTTSLTYVLSELRTLEQTTENLAPSCPQGPQMQQSGWGPACRWARAGRTLRCCLHCVCTHLHKWSRSQCGVFSFILPVQSTGELLSRNRCIEIFLIHYSVGVTTHYLSL